MKQSQIGTCLLVVICNELAVPEEGIHILENDKRVLGGGLHGGLDGVIRELRVRGLLTMRVAVLH